MGLVRNACRILVEKPEGKRPCGRTRRRWENNIKTELREIMWEAADWIHLTQNGDRWRDPANTVMKIRVS
jgi:hypothetical protein